MARSAAHRGDGGTQKGRIRGERGGREALVDVCCSATSDAVVLTCAPPRLELHHHAPDAAPDGAKAETCSLERHWQWINVGEKNVGPGGWRMENGKKFNTRRAHHAPCTPLCAMRIAVPSQSHAPCALRGHSTRLRLRVLLRLGSLDSPAAPRASPCATARSPAPWLASAPCPARHRGLPLQFCRRVFPSS
jgi:hypothetical protein